MPENYTLDEKSEKLLKKLNTGDIASFYVTCDSSLGTAGLVVRKTTRLGKDTTRSLGGDLRKTLGVSKFCRGMVLKPRDSTGLTFLSYGGNIPEARLQKFFRLQLAPDYSTIRSRLKSADVLSAGFLKKASPEQLDNLGLATDALHDDDGDSAEAEAEEMAVDGDGTTDLAADIHAEHRQLIDEAEAHWQAARGTPEEPEATRKLAESLSSGEELFPAAGGSHDTEKMAALYDHLIEGWRTTTPETVPRALFREPDERKDLKPRPLMYRGTTWHVLCARSFVPGMTWADGSSDHIALVQYDGEQSDVLEDLLAETEESLSTAREALPAQRKKYGDATALKEYHDTTAQLAAKYEERVRKALNLLIVRDPTPTLTEGQVEELSDLLFQATRLGNVLRLEQEYIIEERADIPPPPNDEPMPEYDAPEQETTREKDLRVSLEELQEICIKKLLKHEGSFKFNLAPGIYPDIIREKTFPLPRRKTLSKSLGELGYGENITGSFVMESMSRMGGRERIAVFFFDLDTPSSTTALRIKGLIQRYGGKAHYLPEGARRTLKSLGKIKDPDAHAKAVDDLKESERKTLYADYEVLIEARRAEIKAEDALLPEHLRMAEVEYHAIAVMLADPTCREIILCQAEEEFSRENPAFVVAVLPSLAALRPLFPELTPMLALTNEARTRWIYEQFVSPSAEMQVNISSGLRAWIRARADEGRLSPSVIAEYQASVREVFTVIKDTISRSSLKSSQ